MKEQLFITEFDETVLPEEYHFSHNVAVRLHDDLVWLLDDKTIQKKLNVQIKFKPGDKRPKENEKDILAWLSKNGRQKEVDQIISSHTLFALISDTCHFIYESLSSAKNVKMTVAYSLIRKPFLENLLIIEQLLIDEKAFLLKFEEKPEDFDPGKINDAQKKQLINDCLSKINSAFLSQDIIFDLRFDKKNPSSIYAISNLATHLVTTRHPDFRTNANNLNLIFSGFDEWNSQLGHYYFFMPHLLFYAAEVIDKYLLEKKIITLKNYKKRRFYRLIGQLLRHDQGDKKSISGNSSSNKIVRYMKMKCKSCNKTNQLYKSDLFTLINNNHILCKHCLINLFSENNSLDITINKFQG